MTKYFTALIPLILCLIVTPANAEKPEWAGSKKEQKKLKIEKQEKTATKQKNNQPRLFSNTERELITDYYDPNTPTKHKKHKGKQKALPKGLQKMLARGGELPPGWQKKLERGEVIDPTLKAASEPLPEDLLSRLPNDQRLTEMIKVRDKVIKVVKGEGTVVDIIDLTEVLTGTGSKY